MYSKTINIFNNNIKALRLFVKNVESIVVKEDNNEDVSNIAEILLTTRCLQKVCPEEYAMEPEINKKSEKLISVADVASEEVINNLKNKWLASGKIKNNDEFIEIAKERFSAQLLKAKRTLNNMQMEKKQAEILYQSSLLNLIVYFESLISDLFRYQYTKYPESIALQEKSLTFKEIQKFSSFAEAEKYLIEDELEKTMKEGLDDWVKYFVKKRNLSLEYFQSVKGQLVEIFTRRNIFVHNGGIVNSIYLNKVSEEYRKNINIGKKLVVDRDYINKAIDLVECIGVLITIEVWYNQERKNKDIVTDLNNIGYYYMNDKKWEIAIEIFKLIKKNKAFNKVVQSDKLMIELNYWLCEKTLNGFNSINKEIMEQDYSAYSLRYQLPLLALQENYEEFFLLLPKAYPSDVSLKELKEWSIFENIREQSGYVEFLKSNRLTEVFEDTIIEKEIQKEVIPKKIEKQFKYTSNTKVNINSLKRKFKATLNA